MDKKKNVLIGSIASVVVLCVLLAIFLIGRDGEKEQTPDEGLKIDVFEEENQESMDYDDLIEGEVVQEQSTTEADSKNEDSEQGDNNPTKDNPSNTGNGNGTSDGTGDSTTDNGTSDDTNEGTNGDTDNEPEDSNVSEDGNEWGPIQ